MTEAKDKDAAGAPIEPPQAKAQRGDPFLVMLIRHSDEGAQVSWSSHVTVIVHGALIEGHIISHKKWLLEMVDGMKNANLLDSKNTPLGEEARKGWMQGFEHVHEELSRETMQPEVFHYLCLRDVRIHNGFKGTTTPLMRIRIDHISSFSLGAPQ